MNRRSFIVSSLLTGCTLPLFANSNFDMKVNKRFIVMPVHLSFLKKFFTPEAFGKKAKMAPYFEDAGKLADKMTFFSNIQGAKIGGHALAKYSLSGTPGISIDQLIGHHTQGSCLQPAISLQCLSPARASLNQFSWLDKGTPVHQERDVHFLHKKYLAKISQTEFEGKRFFLKKLREEFAKSPNATLYKDQFELLLNASKNVENKLNKKMAQQNQMPDYTKKLPDDLRFDVNAVQVLSHMMNMGYFMLANKLTNVLQIAVPSFNSPLNVNGKITSTGYHNLSHHGNSKSKIKELNLIEGALVTEFLNLAKLLDSTPEGRGTMLDNTVMVLVGAMGDADRHRPFDRPLCILGGNLNHQGHLDAKNAPYTDIYLSIARSFGIEINKYNGSKGNFDLLLSKA